MFLFLNNFYIFVTEYNIFKSKMYYLLIVLFDVGSYIHTLLVYFIVMTILIMVITVHCCNAILSSIFSMA